MSNLLTEGEQVSSHQSFSCKHSFFGERLKLSLLLTRHIRAGSGLNILWECINGAHQVIVILPESKRASENQRQKASHLFTNVFLAICAAILSPS